MAPWHWPYRSVYLVGFCVCMLLLGYAWCLEPLSGLGACRLCLVQVAAFLWMGLCYFVGGLHAPRDGRRWIYAALVVLGSLAGLAAAIPHMLAPSPAVQSLACRADDCTRFAWRLLGLPMSAWAMIWYLLLAAFAIHGAIHPFSPRQLARTRETQSEATQE